MDSNTLSPVGGVLQAAHLSMYTLMVKSNVVHYLHFIGTRTPLEWEADLELYVKSQREGSLDAPVRVKEAASFFLKLGYELSHSHSKSSTLLFDAEFGRIVKHSYWMERRNYQYYKLTKAWMEELSPGKLLIDVGSNGTPVPTWGTFERRISVDIARNPDAEIFPNVEEVIQDWMTYPVETKADLVTCCQVLEHLPDDVVSPFAKKLCSSGTRALISVPFKWAKGACKDHLQDPVDLQKLCGWIGRDPLRSEVIVDLGAARLVTLF